MGVTGLWTVVQPCARPVKLETLNKKRLAVDASIWIYQFLKAVRDKEGNALRNSHVVGFFRRICKLLFYGIKPVFVFDGGAPILKRQTIAARKKRREGRREDAARTAGKLLAVQMQRIAEETTATKRTDESRRREEEKVPDNPVYVEERFMTEKEKQQSRGFRKKDAYHLPNLNLSLEDMGSPDDPRIMSREELEEYARQFHQGEDINLYDFSKIDFDSPFFLSLPATDRYNILNAARLRSRLRMGYSKEQLDNMFPDRMAFSKFQIERVKERNDLTQRLMNLNGMNGEDALYGSNVGQRIAGERGREYVLVKDNAVEGGWALGVVGNKEGQEDKPIDVDLDPNPDLFLDKDGYSDDEAGFEDVPIEGLNRLPKLPFLRPGVFDQSVQQQLDEVSGRQRAVFASEQEGVTKSAWSHDEDALFVESDHIPSASLNEASQDNVRESHDIFEDEDLRKAIEMSMETDNDPFNKDMPGQLDKPASPVREYTIGPILDSDEEEMDFATALARSKKPGRDRSSTEQGQRIRLSSHAFDGPLPFESMKIGNSLDRTKSEDAMMDKDAGGCLLEQSKPKKEALSLPPWFSGDRLSKEEFINDQEGDLLKGHEEVTSSGHQFLRNRRSPEVIDVDRLSASQDVVDLEDKDEKGTGKNRIASSIPENEEAETEGNYPVEATPSVELSETSVRHTSSPNPLPLNGDGNKQNITYGEPASQEQSTQESRSLSPGFEDVEVHSQSRETNTSSPTVLSGGERDEDIMEITAQNGDMDDEGDCSDPEDADLMRQLADEAEEHVRFTATLNAGVPHRSLVDYEEELKQLRSQQKKDRRDADEVTQVMIGECQQLLTLFGLPYITAPMEAEAQCAKLVALGLVDGVVTDDSDIFLFGGTRVYKNVFNQSKFVECYLTSDMEKEYALHRRKLISFAHLLGSDYTEGIPGIGPVTALEILTEFDSLDEFCDWWTQVQMGKDMSQNAHSTFYKRFRKNATKIFLPPSFPNSHVDLAYLQPEVDSDPSPFQWGVPDLNGLRNFLMATVGWSQERTDEVLVPVIRDMNRREHEGTQSNITGFFSGLQGAGAFAPRVRSGGQSRMERAFSRLRREAGSHRNSKGENVQDGASDTICESTAVTNKRNKANSKRHGRSPEQSGSADSDATISKKRKTRERMR